MATVLYPVLLVCLYLLRNLQVEIRLSTKEVEDPRIVKEDTQTLENDSDDDGGGVSGLEDSPKRGASKAKSPQDAPTEPHTEDQAEGCDSPQRSPRERKETTHLNKYLDHLTCVDLVDSLLPRKRSRQLHTGCSETMNPDLPHDHDSCLRILPPRSCSFNHFAFKRRYTGSRQPIDPTEFPNTSEAPTNLREWSSPPSVEEALDFDERDRRTREMHADYISDADTHYEHPDQNLPPTCANSMMVQHGGAETYASDSETDSRFDPYDLPTYEYGYEPLDASPNASFPAPLAVDPSRDPCDHAERWDHNEESFDDTQGWGSEAVEQTEDEHEGQSWESDQPREGLEDTASETSEEFSDVMDEAEPEGFTDVMSDKEEPQGHRLQDWKAAGREDDYW